MRKISKGLAIVATVLAIAGMSLVAVAQTGGPPGSGSSGAGSTGNGSRGYGAYGYGPMRDMHGQGGPGYGPSGAGPMGYGPRGSRSSGYGPMRDGWMGYMHGQRGYGMMGGWGR